MTLCQASEFGSQKEMPAEVPGVLAEFGSWPGAHRRRAISRYELCQPIVAVGVAPMFWTTRVEIADKALRLNTSDSPSRAT